MPKILKIEESKIVTKNGLQVQRVIFSDDKIVYIKMDDGEVYPKDTTDKYVNLINTYNASHDNIDSTKPKVDPSAFWSSGVNHIKDGSPDRTNQIKETKDKKRLSKDRDTQRAINRMRDFGLVLTICGMVEIIVDVVAVMLLLPNIPSTMKTSLLLLYAIPIILGILWTILGCRVRQLKIGPSGIRATAITGIIICILILIFNGLLGLGGILVFIYAIIALVKLGRYEEWFYGEIE